MTHNLKKLLPLRPTENQFSSLSCLSAFLPCHSNKCFAKYLLMFYGYLLQSFSYILAIYILTSVPISSIHANLA